MNRLLSPYAFCNDNGTPYQQFGSDTFTDTDGTAITAHTNDALVAWTLQAGISSATPALINNNRVYSTDVNNTYTSNFIPNSADYEVYGKFYKYSAGTAGITARASTSANTYYCLRYDGIGWQINRVLNGVSVQIGNAYLDDAWADGTEREAILWLSGNIIKAFIDGVEVISTADFLITDAGRGGISLDSPSTPSTGIHMTLFQVRQPVLTPTVLSLRDDYTDTNGVKLSVHAPNSGGAWIRTQSDTPYSDASNPVIHNNNLVMVTNGHRWRFSNNLSTNDYEIMFAVTRVSSDATTLISISGRMRGTVGQPTNQYQLRHSATSGNWTLGRTVEGTFTDGLATYADAGFVGGQSRRGRIVFKGTSIQVWIDDVIAINYTNTVITTGDTVGIESSSSGTPHTTTTGLHIERISVNGIVESGYDNLYDNFDAPDNTTINNYRTSESGYLWVPQSSTPSPLPKILNKRLLSNAGATYKLGYTMQTPNYEVTGVFFVASATGIYGITARASENTAFTLYRFQGRDTGTWSLRKYISSTETILASFSQTLTGGSNVKATLRCNGSTITCLVNDSPVITVIDTEITNAGRAGYSCGFGASDVQGLQLDTFIVKAL